MRDLFNTLQPIRLASEALGRRDANLLTAEGTLSFLFSKLKKLDTSIPNEIYDALVKGIEEQRNKELVSAMMFLNNKSLSSIPELPVLTRMQLFKFIKEETHNLIKTEQSTEESAEQDDFHKQESSMLTLEQQLESSIQEYSKSQTPSTESADLSKVLQKELTLFELYG